MSWGRPERQSQDGDAWIILGSKQQGISEVQIEGDEATTIGPAGPNQTPVRAGREALLLRGDRVMPRFTKKPCRPRTQALMQLDLQRLASSGISTKRSLAISAP